jgi:protein TonB
MVRTVNALLAVLLGAAITFSLFYLMQSLIAAGIGEPEQREVIRIADITIPELEIEITRAEPKPQEPEEPEEAPELPDLQADTMEMNTGEGLNITRVEVDLGAVDTNVAVGINDTEMLPIVTVQPQYPNRALSRGIEGWCLVSFTVTATGTVENPVVVDADPPDIFNNSSIRAVERFKFNPRVEDGVPVPVEGVQYLFRYNVDE